MAEAKERSLKLRIGGTVGDASDYCRSVFRHRKLPLGWTGFALLTRLHADPDLPEGREIAVIA